MYLKVECVSKEQKESEKNLISPTEEKLPSNRQNYSNNRRDGRNLKASADKKGSLWNREILDIILHRPGPRIKPTKS